MTGFVVLAVVAVYALAVVLLLVARKSTKIDDAYIERYVAKRERRHLRLADSQERRTPQP